MKAILDGIKKNQRVIIAGTTIAVLIAVFLFILLPNLTSRADSTLFTQTDWSTGAEASSSTTSATGWAKYDSGTNINDTTAGQVVLTSSGAAAWTAGGVEVTTNSADDEHPEVISDGAGGAIMVWQDERNGSTNQDIYAQRIDSTGTQLWNSGSDVGISTATGHQSYPSIASDGSGGAIIAWQSGTGFDIYAQRVDANGNVQWTANGVVVSSASGNQLYAQITEDGSGGAIIAWYDSDTADVYAQRINASGAVQWTANGVGVLAVGTAIYGYTLMSDGSGGAYIVSHQGVSSPNIYAQLLNGSGVAQWTAGGIIISNAADNQYVPQIASDGSGGAIIAWQDERGGGSASDIYAQRVTSAGAVQWTANGVAISTVGSLNDQTPSIASDGSGGAIIAWDTGADIYAQRVNGSGAVQWAVGGVVVSNATGTQRTVGIDTDGSGGAVMAWEDARSGNYDVYGQRVNASGTMLWTANGVLMGTGAGTQTIYDADTHNSYMRDYSENVVSDGSGGLIAVWEDYTSSAYDVSIQRVSVTFNSPGSFTSSIFDAGAEMNWSALEWDATIPASTQFAFEARTSNDALAWDCTFGGTCTSTAVTSGTTGSVALDSANGRYIQHKITITGLSTSSPTLTEVRLVGGTANTAPAATTPTSISQAGNTTGYITFQTAISDADSNNTKVKVEYSDDGGSTWYDPDLVSAAASGGTVSMSDSDTYQIGTSDAVDTSGGAITLTVVWDTQSASNGNGSLNNTNQSDIKVRVTPNDATVDGTAQASANFTVDNVYSVATTPTSIAQASDSTGYVTFQTTISDADNTNTKVKVEYSDDGGSTWYDPDLVSATPSGGTVSMSNSDAYQIGTSNTIDTSTGSITLTIVWDTKSASNGNGSLNNTNQSDIRVRVTPNDGTADAAVQTSVNFTVDNEIPNAPGNLTLGSKTASSVTLTFGAASVISDFDHYTIYYKSGSSGVATSDSAWTSANDSDLGSVSYNSTTSTTITGLTEGASYYFNIWVYDGAGNTVSAVELGPIEPQLNITSEITANVAVANDDNTASVRLSQSAIDEITTAGYENITMDRDTTIATNFEGVSEDYHYSITLDDEADIITLTNPITITLNFPERGDYADVVVYHDALHNGFASGYATYDATNATVTPTSITFTVTTLSNFILGAKKYPPTYVGEKKTHTVQPRDILKNTAALLGVDVDELISGNEKVRLGEKSWDLRYDGLSAYTKESDSSTDTYGEKVSALQKEVDSLKNDLEIKSRYIESLEKRVQNTEKSGTATVPTAVDTTTASPVAPGSVARGTYVVQLRDNLFSIAEKLYGNVSTWYNLISLNKDKYPTLETSPSVIYPGWELRY